MYEMVHGKRHYCIMLSSNLSNLVTDSSLSECGITTKPAIMAAWLATNPNLADLRFVDLTFSAETAVTNYLPCYDIPPAHQSAAIYLCMSVYLSFIFVLSGAAWKPATLLVMCLCPVLPSVCRQTPRWSPWGTLS